MIIYCPIWHIPWRITAVSKKAGGVWMDFSGVVKAHKATVVTPSRYGSRSGHCWQWKQQMLLMFQVTLILRWTPFYTVHVAKHTGHTVQSEN